MDTKFIDSKKGTNTLFIIALQMWGWNEIGGQIILTKIRDIFSWDGGKVSSTGYNGGVGGGCERKRGRRRRRWWRKSRRCSNGNSSRWEQRNMRRWEEIRFFKFVVQDLIPHCMKLRLQDLYLLLQSWDSSHAPINWISKPHICLVHKAICCISSLGLRHLLFNSTTPKIKREKSSWKP